MNSKLQCCCLTFTGDTEKCTDLSKHCSHWVSKKECTTRPDYMAQNCKKSCEMCGPGKFFFCFAYIQGPTNLLNSLVCFLPFDRLEIAEKLYFVLFLMFCLVSVLVVRFCICIAPRLEYYFDYLASVLLLGRRGYNLRSFWYT